MRLNIIFLWQCQKIVITNNEETTVDRQTSPNDSISFSFVGKWRPTGLGCKFVYHIIYKTTGAVRLQIGRHKRKTFFFILSFPSAMIPWGWRIFERQVLLISAQTHRFTRGSRVLFTVLPDFATSSFLNALNFLTSKDKITFNPIFGLPSSRAIQNIPNMLGYLWRLSS